MGVGVGGGLRVRAALSAALPRGMRGEVRAALGVPRDDDDRDWCAVKDMQRRGSAAGRERGWTLHCVSLTGEVDRRR